MSIVVIDLMDPETDIIVTPSAPVKDRRHRVERPMVTDTVEPQLEIVVPSRKP